MEIGQVGMDGHHVQQHVVQLQSIVCYFIEKVTKSNEVNNIYYRNT